MYKPNQTQRAKLGVIVGKRIANIAAARNRIKRVVRESFRAHKRKLAGLDIVVIARQQCDTLDKIKLREDIDTLWVKLLSHYQRASHK